MAKPKTRAQQVPDTLPPLRRKLVITGRILSPFLTTLDRDVRNLIYAYLDFHPFPEYLESFGLFISCRQAYSETSHESVHRLRVYFERLRVRAEKEGTKFRLLTPLSSKDALLRVRSLTVEIEHLKHLPVSDGLLKLVLDRLEVRLSKNPLDEYRNKAKFGQWKWRAKFIRWLILELCCAATNSMNVKELCVSWCIPTNPATDTSKCKLQGRQSRMKKSSQKIFFAKMGLPSSYPIPSFSWATSENGDVGKIILRSEVRWQPQSLWVKYWGQYRCLHSLEEGGPQRGCLRWRQKPLFLEYDAEQD